MTRRIPWALVAALAMGSAYAQTQAPVDPGAAATPGSTNPSKGDPSTTTPSGVSPSPAQPDRIGGLAQKTSPNDLDQSDTRPTRIAEAARVGKKAGMSAGTIVQSPAGEVIGTVKDVVPDSATGQPNYILVATRSGANTAIPYSILAPMMRNGRVVLDRSRLEKSPRVSDRELQNKSDLSWQRQVQKYWNGMGPKEDR